MYAKGFSRETIESAAFRLTMHVDIEEQPGRIKFTVRNGGSSNHYHSVSANGRNNRSIVCFHGHYALFKKMFELEGNPDASIESSWFGKVIYTPDTLREKAQEFGMQRLNDDPRSSYYNLRRKDLCECEKLYGTDYEGIY